MRSELSVASGTGLYILFSDLVLRILETVFSIAVAGGATVVAEAATGSLFGYGCSYGTCTNRLSKVRLWLYFCN